MDTNQKTDQQSEITQAEKETQKNANEASKKSTAPPSEENKIRNGKPVIPPNTDTSQDGDDGTDVADNRTEKKNIAKEQDAENSKRETHTYLN